MNKLAFKPALNLTEQIAEHLAQLIIHGKMLGGDRIQELKVARDLDVSRGSVREALLILERRHLIEILPRRGAIVNTIEADDALSLWEMLAPAEQRWLHHLVMANPRAVPSARLADGAAEVIVSMERAARQDAIVELLQQREAFYAHLLRCASKYTRAVFECLLPSSQRVLFRLLEQSALEQHDVARYYRALYQAILQADLDRLDELLAAFYKRLHQLCSKSLSARDARHFPAGLKQWSGNTRSQGLGER